MITMTIKKWMWSYDNFWFNLFQFCIEVIYQTWPIRNELSIAQFLIKIKFAKVTRAF